MNTLEIPAPEFVKRFQSGEIPTNARVTVTFEDDGDVQDPTLALIEKWLSEAPTDAAEIAEAEADLRELQLALNTTRKQAGARILYPSIEPDSETLWVCGSSSTQGHSAF